MCKIGNLRVCHSRKNARFSFLWPCVFPFCRPVSSSCSLIFSLLLFFLDLQAFIAPYPVASAVCVRHFLPAASANEELGHIIPLASAGNTLCCQSVGRQNNLFPAITYTSPHVVIFALSGVLKNSNMIDFLVRIIFFVQVLILLCRFLPREALDADHAAALVACYFRRSCAADCPTAVTDHKAVSLRLSDLSPAASAQDVAAFPRHARCRFLSLHYESSLNTTTIRNSVTRLGVCRQPLQIARLCPDAQSGIS